MKNIIKAFDYLVYWSIVFLPFSISISPAPMNVFMGFLIVGFLAKKLLKKKIIFINTAINTPLALLFLVTCLSVFNSISFSETFRAGIVRLIDYILVFFAVSSEIRDQKHIRRIIFLTAAGLTLASFDTIWQVITGHDFIRGYEPVINIGLVRATASFKDSNTLGIYLSGLAPLVFGLAIYHLKGLKRMALFFISLLILTGIVLTYSRPTLLAIYIALFFFALIKKDKVLLALLLILTLVSPFILPRSVKDWARQVNYNPLRFMCNDDRIAVYRNALNMIKAHPVIGVGAGAFMKSYKKYKEFPEYRNVVTLDEMKAHNNFLHMAAEIGLVGFGIFVWMLYKLFMECINTYRHLDDKFFKVILLSLSASLISFLINGLTESSLYYSRVAIIFWYLVGFSLSLKKFAPGAS